MNTRIKTRAIPVAVFAITLLCSCAAWAQGHYIGELIDIEGRAIANARILVCSEPAVGVPCLPQTVVYSDVAQTQQLPMPFVSDRDGNFDFYAPCDVGYHLQISAPTIQTFDVPYVFIPCLVASGQNGIPINKLLAATGSNSINNGSFDQDWNWSLTGTNAVAGLAISENAPSTNTDPNSVLFAVGTRTGSTVPPFEAGAHDGAGGLLVTTNGDIAATGSATFIGPLRLPALRGQPVLGTDALGNVIAGTGGTGSTALSSITQATATNSINNGSFDQDWNWSLTGTNAVAGFAVSENVASTNTNPNSVLFTVGTRTQSTVTPFSVGAQDGAGGVQVTPNGDLQLTGRAKFLIPDWSGVTTELHTVFGGQGNVYLAGAATTNNADQWIAHGQNAAIIQLGSPGGRTGGFTLYANGGLTAGSVFTPTAVFGVSGTGAIQSSSLASGVTSCLQADPTGIITVTGLQCGGSGTSTPISLLTQATATNVINNGSFDQNWNWSLTGSNAVVGLGIAENVASTNTNSNSVLMAVETRAGSTVPPFEAMAHNGAAGLEVTTNGDVSAVGSARFVGPINNVAGGAVASGTLAVWQTGGTCSTTAAAENVCTSVLAIPGNPFRNTFFVVCSPGAIGAGSPALVEAGPQAVNPTNSILIAVRNGAANGAVVSSYSFLTCMAFGT